MALVVRSLATELSNFGQDTARSVTLMLVAFLVWTRASVADGSGIPSWKRARSWSIGTAHNVELIHVGVLTAHRLPSAWPSLQFKSRRDTVNTLIKLLNKTVYCKAISTTTCCAPR
jgi:hypothetical protein